MCFETTAERREFWAMIDNLIRQGQRERADDYIQQREKMKEAFDKAKA